MVMQGNCDVNANTDQSIVCQLVGQKCANLNYNCSNIAVVDYSCNSLQKFADLAALVLSAEPPEVQKKYSSSGEAISTETLTQIMLTKIQASCASVATATQSIESSLQCSESSNVVVNVLNTMDATAACVTLQVATMVAEAREALVLPLIPKPPLTNPATIAVVLGGAALVGVAIMFALWKL